MNRIDKESVIAEAIKNINRTNITQVTFPGIFHICVYVSSYARVKELTDIQEKFARQFKGPISDISWHITNFGGRFYMEIVLSAPLTGD